MLRQILDQMQFKLEGTGGGCECMALYTHGHAVIVSIDASVNFDLAHPDNPIAVGVYSGASAGNWGDDNLVSIKQGVTQSEAINDVIEALLLAERLESQVTEKMDQATYELWQVIARRIGRPQACANEIELSELRYQDQCLVKGFRQIWEGLN